MSRVDWSERAVQDFAAALSFIAEDNPAAAGLVRGRILNTLKHLESFSLGTPGPNGSLKLYIPRTSFFVIFRRDANGDISIRAFLHASRDWENVKPENL